MPSKIKIGLWSINLKWIFISIAIAVAGGVTWYFSSSADDADVLSASLINSAGVSESPSTEEHIDPEIKKEIEAIIQQVSRLILLPSEQEPVIATIQNAEVLASQQAFYQSAVDGDKLLVYPQKALIYRPTENKLINVGPVYFNTQPLSVDIRNASQTADLAEAAQEKLSASKGYTVLSTSIPVQGSYLDNTIVNLTGKDVSVLVQEFGADVLTELPSGETESEADVVLILSGSSDDE